MAYQFVGVPKKVESTVYENTVDKIVDLLKIEKSLLSIYRLGNVNHPGISDLDIIAVFDNDQKCEANPEIRFNDEERYLVTHSIGGASVEHFLELLPFTFWDNLKCIWGEELIAGSESVALEKSDEEKHKVQIAMEFLVKNFLELSVQQHYGVFKLRSILQEIKGIRYDLKFLKMENEPINERVNQLLNLLDQWFDKPFNRATFGEWLDAYIASLLDILDKLNRDKKQLWLPYKEHYQYGRNVTIEKGNNYRIHTSGIFVPASLIKNKKLYNAQARLNSFKATLPFHSSDNSGIQQKRLQTFQSHKNYNKMYLPHFGPLHSSLAENFI